MPYLVCSPKQAACPLPLKGNETIDAMQTCRKGGADLWKGDIIVLKYADQRHSHFVDCVASDLGVLIPYFTL